MHHPDSRPRRFQPFPTGNKATGTTSPWPAAEPIPEGRFTRIGGELYRLRKRAVPCIRPREAASESLATAIDGGYQVELLGKLALGRESRPVTAGPALIGWRNDGRKIRESRQIPAPTTKEQQ